MIKISILYPNKVGGRFDMAYYLDTHMPMSIERLSAAQGFVGVSVEEGVRGEDPDSPPAYVAMCDYLFDSLDAFMSAFLPHAGLLQDDMRNYTDIAPLIQVNTVHIYRPARESAAATARV